MADMLAGLHTPNFPSHRRRPGRSRGRSHADGLPTVLLGSSCATAPGCAVRSASSARSAALAGAVPARRRIAQPSILRCSPAETASEPGGTSSPDDRTGAGVSAVPDGRPVPRMCYRNPVRTVGADGGLVFGYPVVVDEHRRGADVAAFADRRVTDVGEVRDLSAPPDRGILHLDEGADLAVLAELCAGPQVGEGADVCARADVRAVARWVRDHGGR